MTDAPKDQQELIAHANKLIVETRDAFKTMLELNASVFKVTPGTDGREFFAIILVAGEEETKAVLEAVRAVEDSWE